MTTEALERRVADLERAVVTAGVSAICARFANDGDIAWNIGAPIRLSDESDGHGWRRIVVEPAVDEFDGVKFRKDGASK